PGQGHLTGYRGASGGARRAQGAHRYARRGVAARPSQGGRRRADRLPVLYSAGPERRQGAPYGARSHSRDSEELGVPAKSESGGPELRQNSTFMSGGGGSCRPFFRPALAPARSLRPLASTRVGGGAVNEGFISQRRLRSRISQVAISGAKFVTEFVSFHSSS